MLVSKWRCMPVYFIKLPQIIAHFSAWPAPAAKLSGAAHLNARCENRVLHIPVNELAMLHALQHLSAYDFLLAQRCSRLAWLHG